MAVFMVMVVFMIVMGMVVFTVIIVVMPVRPVVSAFKRTMVEFLHAGQP